MKRLIIVVVIMVGVGVGAGAYYLRHNGGELQVNTLPITRGPIIDSVGSTGTLQAVTTVTVGSQVSGNISELNADFNSIVHKGQILARLDPTLFNAQLAQSTANLANAKAELGKDTVTNTYQKLTLDRNTDLQKRGLITQDALDAAKTAYEQGLAQLEVDKAQIQQATAQLNQNQTNLDHTILTSPIDGIVTQRSVDIGQTVAASMQAPTIFMIAADLTKMQVNASIDESDVGRIRPNQNVTFRVDAYPGQEFDGVVVQIRLNPAIVQNVTTYNVIINVPNTDLKLKPGMTANLKVEVAKRDDTLRVPNVALRFRPSNDVFAALNEPVPPEAQTGGGRGGGRGRQPGGGAAPATAAAPAAPPTSLVPAPPASADQSSAVPAPGGDGAAGRGRGGAGRNFGGGGGRGNGGGRAQQLDRFKAMSAADQKQFIDRMKARGQDTTEYEKAENQPAKAGGKAGTTTVQQKYGGPQSAETIDALFPPVPTVELAGRVWLYIDNQLKPIRVRTGITDGNQTELLDGAGLDVNTEIVTGVVLPSGARPAAGATGNGNPLLPGNRGGQGGFGGGQQFPPARGR